MSAEVRVAGDADLARCYEIRRSVFIDEQRVSREEEFDGLDASCIHFIAQIDGRPVGTARLRPNPDGASGCAKAQRVAVLRDSRRLGVGADLMRALEDESRRLGLSQVILHAQTDAIPFYESIGYRAEGDEFFEADIPHRLMRKRLTQARADVPDAGR